MARDRSAIDEWEPYVPNIDEERRLYLEGSPEAITMEIKHLSKREKERYQNIAARAEKSPEARRRARNAMQQLFTEHVREITNYIWEGCPVITGADLYETDDDDIKIDVTAALIHRGRLEAGLIKKLRLLSNTYTAQAKMSEDGAARDVTQQSHQETPVTSTQKTQNSHSTTQKNDTTEIVTGKPATTLELAGTAS